VNTATTVNAQAMLTDDWLEAQLATPHGQLLYDTAEKLQFEIRKDQGRVMAIFARNGRRLWKLKVHNLHRFLGLPSFDVFVSEPDNGLNPSSAHLSVQVFDVVWATFLITPGYIEAYNVVNNTSLPTDIIERIGEGKLQVIAPQIQALADRFNRLSNFRPDVKLRSNRLEYLWCQYRLRVLEWLRKGWALARSDLKTEVQYTEGWETYWNQPMQAATLRQMDRDNLLAILCPPDVPNDASVVINVKGRKASPSRKT
jgi:hypothetical protein